MTYFVTDISTIHAVVSWSCDLIELFYVAGLLKVDEVVFWL